MFIVFSYDVIEIRGYFLKYVVEIEIPVYGLSLALIEQTGLATAKGHVAEGCTAIRIQIEPVLIKLSSIKYLRTNSGLFKTHGVASTYDSINPVKLKP